MEKGGWNMTEQEVVVDALVVLDGKNPSFLTYITHEQAQEIYDVGGTNYDEKVILKETPDRKVPTSLVRG